MRWKPSGRTQEAADELVGVEGHRLSFVMVAIILPQEADAAVGESEEAAVGDGDAMGIAGEIIEHLLGSAERSLGIDDPGNGPQAAGRRRIRLVRPSSPDCRKT